MGAIEARQTEIANGLAAAEHGQSALTRAKGEADKILAEHKNLGNPLNVELVQGPAASVITHAAEKNGHDLIAVGAHGHRGVRRLLLGSVAESTIRHSPCSVLVVHGEHHAK